MLRRLNKSGKERRAGRKMLLDTLEMNIIDLETSFKRNSLIDEKFIQVLNQLQRIKNAENDNQNEKSGKKVKNVQGKNSIDTVELIELSSNILEKIENNDKNCYKFPVKKGTQTKEIKKKSNDFFGIAADSKKTLEIDGKFSNSQIDNRISTFMILAQSLLNDDRNNSYYSTLSLTQQERALTPFTENELSLINKLLQNQRRIIIRKINDS